jgi:hypothetical protein
MRTVMLACLGLSVIVVGCQNSDSSSSTVTLSRPVAARPSGGQKPMLPPVGKLDASHLASGQVTRPTRICEPNRNQHGEVVPTISEELGQSGQSSETLTSGRTAPSGVTVYQVRKGDTLWKIAKQHLGAGRRWKEIARVNPDLDYMKLRVGQRIRLPIN